MTREEAINEINKVFTSAYANYIVTALTEGATVSDIQRRWGRAYEAGVKDGLEQEPRWIPVTERLPREEPNTYWICTNNGCQCECRWTNVNPFWSYDTTDWHWNIADIPQYTKVVAWMPLPKPYGLESESEVEE